MITGIGRGEKTLQYIIAIIYYEARGTVLARIQHYPAQLISCSFSVELRTINKIWNETSADVCLQLGNNYREVSMCIGSTVRNMMTKDDEPLDSFPVQPAKRMQFQCLANALQALEAQKRAVRQLNFIVADLTASKRSLNSQNGNPQNLYTWLSTKWRLLSTQRSWPLSTRCLTLP